MAGSCSSFCGVDPRLYKFDVFISFRGEDTGNNLTRHLHSALREKQIEVYVENVLEEGNDIERAIEESAISIIIFSENYDSSAWCLDQLVHILKCKNKKKGSDCFAIFHGVDPSHIRKSYAAAFVKHRTRNKVRKWRRALIIASRLPGWDSRGKSDSELVETVVQDVLRRLTEIRSTSIDNSDGVLGGAFLSAFVEDLFRRLRSPDFLDYLEGKEPIQKLLKGVRTKLLSANMVLDDAEEKQLTNAAVKEWLDHLKELIFRADEWIDKIAESFLSTFDKSMEEEIAGILYELELLVAQKDELGLKKLTGNVVSQRLPCAPLALKPEFYGREAVKEAITKLVLSDETYGDKKPMALPIVGAGGISKTTPGEDLNAHLDLLPIIVEKTGGIGKTSLGEYLNVHLDLQGIREEIDRKCKGHPIAVKSVLALLCSIPSPDEWRKILENHIWDLKLQENASKDVLPALWLSYRYLSSLLKRCLVYCSIFPKGYEFDKKKKSNLVVDG